MVVELICIGAVVLLSVAFAFAVSRMPCAIMNSYSKEVGKILAQADESRKAAWVELEHMSGRLVAVAYPVGHQVHRTTSGVIEGAQLTTAQHFKDNPPPDQAPLDPTTGLDRIMERNGHDTPRSRIVPTPGEYEEHGEGEQP